MFRFFLRGIPSYWELYTLLLNIIHVIMRLPQVKRNFRHIKCGNGHTPFEEINASSFERITKKHNICMLIL